MPNDKSKKGTAGEPVTESGEKPSRLPPEGSRKPKPGPQIGKIRSKTSKKAKAAMAESKTFSTVDEPKKESRAKRAFRSLFTKMVFLSLVLHTPIIAGSIGKKGHSGWNPLNMFDSGLSLSTLGDGKKEEKLDVKPPEWEEEIVKDLSDEYGEKETETIMDEIDNEELEGYEKAKIAIKQRLEERGGKVDKEALELFLQNIRTRLEAGEEVSYREFVWGLEKFGEGIDPQVVEQAMQTFLAEMAELQKSLVNPATRKFLQMIVTFTESQEKGEAYDPTRTSVAEYMARKGLGKRGNCVARQKYTSMALEYLYPDQKDNIFIQKFGDHIRTLFLVNGTYYVMEPGVPVLTEKDMAGTLIYPLRDQILASTGEDIKKKTAEGSFESAKADIPIITDGRAFKDPQGDKALKNFSKNHAQLYRERFTPPETNKTELPSSSKKQREEILSKKTDEERRKILEGEEKRRASRAERTESGKEVADAPAIPGGPQQVAEWQVVLATGDKAATDKPWEWDEVEGILPWNPVDYDDFDISSRVINGNFHGGNPDRPTPEGTKVRNIYNPSVETIKKINSYYLENIYFPDVSTFSQASLNELFKTKAPKITLSLKSPALPLSLSALLQSKKYSSIRDYEGQLDIYISGDEIDDKLVNKDFPEDQFRSLMEGKGGLNLHYFGDKALSEKEIGMIAASTRPYVYMSGSVCNYNAKALTKMAESKNTVLLFNETVYFELLIRNPELLLIDKIQLDDMYFTKNRLSLASKSIPNDRVLMNMALVENRILQMVKEGQKEQAAKLNEIADFLMEKIAGVTFLNRNSKERKEQINKFLEDHPDYVGPIGCMGVCLPPPDFAGPYFVSDETGTNILQVRPIPEGPVKYQIFGDPTQTPFIYMSDKYTGGAIRIRIMPDNSLVRVTSDGQEKELTDDQRAQAEEYIRNYR